MLYLFNDNHVEPLVKHDTNQLVFHKHTFQNKYTNTERNDCGMFSW